MEKVKKLYVALVVLFLYAPIGVLVAQSFNASRYRGHWTGFTLQWYGELFQNEGIFDALQNTITIGLSSAAIATVLGLLTCMALRGMGRKQRSVYLGVASMPLLNADIVTGISLMLLFLGMGLRLGYGSILMAHVVFNLPYVILCIMPQFLSLDRSCYDAARDLGATPFVAFRRVVLPELRPSLLAGFMLAFTMSADDFIITHFTKGAGIDTLPNLCRIEIGHPSGNVCPFDARIRLCPGLRRPAHRQPPAPGPGSELVGKGKRYEIYPHDSPRSLLYPGPERLWLL